MKLINLNSNGEIVISDLLLEQILNMIATQSRTTHCSRRACVRLRVYSKLGDGYVDREESQVH